MQKKQSAPNDVDFIKLDTHVYFYIEPKPLSMTFTMRETDKTLIATAVYLSGGKVAITYEGPQAERLRTYYRDLEGVKPEQSSADTPLGSKQFWALVYDGGRPFFAVFCNHKGSSSLRCYSVTNGRPGVMKIAKGITYQKAFAKYVDGAQELFLDEPISLSSCKAGLPPRTLKTLQIQINMQINLDQSA